ncbi:hypothetical protein G6F58_013023 [Rhizopus delemar]|nr:hypothetical protein G6F58_013023 [Rhizopus delemar]
MSAPPIGSVINTPSASASTKKAPIAQVLSVLAAMIASTTTASATTRFITCWPGQVTRLSRRPSSLAQAITEPDSDTAPIAAPTTASSTTVPDGWRAARSARACSLQCVVSRWARKA